MPHAARLPVVVLTAALAAAAPAASPAQPSAAATGAVHDSVADFTLADQFGRPHAVRFAEAPLTLVVFSGRTTAREGGAWLRQLRPALAAAPAVRVVEVAAVGNPSALVRPIVRRVFRGQPAIPLDWDDAVAARFGYRPGAARALLVDAAGRVRAAASGAPTESAVERFQAAVAGAAEPRPER